MRLFELSEKLNICSLFFISIAKCRNIVKWFPWYLACLIVLLCIQKEFKKDYDVTEA